MRLLSSDVPGSFEDQPGFARNRLVHHLVIHRTHSLLVHEQNLACLGDFLGGWRQHLIDGGDLCRVNGTLSVKTKAWPKLLFPA